MEYWYQSNITWDWQHGAVTPTTSRNRMDWSFPSLVESYLGLTGTWCDIGHIWPIFNLKREFAIDTSPQILYMCNVQHTSMSHEISFSLPPSGYPFYCMYLYVCPLKKCSLLHDRDIIKSQITVSASNWEVPYFFIHIPMGLASITGDYIAMLCLRTTQS